jgi:P63C domain
VAYYTRDLVYERLGPGLLKELEDKSPKNGDGYRPSRFHQWLTDDVGDPLLAQHLHSLVMLQNANGHGWHRFLNSVNLVLPKRGETLGVPLEVGEPQEGE